MVSDLTSVVHRLDCRITDLERENVTLKQRVTAQEDYSRRANIKIDGILEPDTESKNDLKETIYTFFANQLGIINAREIKLNDCHRLGVKGKGQRKSRTVIIQFNWKLDKELVWARKTKLAGTRFYMNEHFSETTTENRKVLYPYVKSARILGEKHLYIGDKLKIADKTYTRANLFEIPSRFNPKDTATVSNDQIVAFHGRDSFLSNWYYAPFRADNQEYVTNEQYYFCKLAEHFGDDIMADKIKKEEDPALCKNMGRRIKNFRQQDAEKIARKILLEANLLKFDEHKILADQLLQTDTRRIGEATKDTTWGVGLSIWDKSIMKAWISG